MRVTPNEQRRAVIEEPPSDNHWQRQSFWVLAFAEARQQPGKWYRIQRFYTSATAQQISSDIRSAHSRPLETLRVKGILPGEVWEAKWGTDEKCPHGHYSIWVRFAGPTSG